MLLFYTDVVELLVVFHEDFERILRPVMEKEWLEKRHSIEALDYFQFFTKDQVTFHGNIAMVVTLSMLAGNRCM